MKKANRKLVIGIVLLVLSIIGIVCFKGSNQKVLMLLSTLSVAAALLLTTLSLSTILSMKRYEKYKKEKPYGFDVYAEYKIYSNVGNKKKSEYLKYSEWKSYIWDEYKTLYDDIYYKEDFKRFLNMNYRNRKASYEAITNIMIPVIIAITTILFAVIKELDITFLGMIIVIVVSTSMISVMLINELFDTKRHIVFYEDLIELFDGFENEQAKE